MLFFELCKFLGRKVQKDFYKHTFIASFCGVK